MDATQFRQAYLELVRQRVAVAASEVDRTLADRFGLDAEETERLALAVLTGEDHSPVPPPLVMLPPDTLVHVPALVDGTVLTHRLSAAEHAEGHLALEGDLAPFLRLPVPRTVAGVLEVHDDVDGLVWCGTAGWLDALPLDALLAVRVSGDGEVALSVLDTDPALSAPLVTAVRAAYDDEIAEPWLPVPAESLALGVLVADRNAFAFPQLPLTELAAAAGLQRRGDEFAHEESVWAAGEESDRQYRLVEHLETEEERLAAVEAHSLLTEAAGDPTALRRALDLLSTSDVLVAVVDELLDETGDAAADAPRVAALEELGERLLAAAGRSPRAAVAGWVAATAAERDGRVLDAESHLRAAGLATDGWELVEDRLAWYESDRGDAAAALGRWLSLDADEDTEDADPQPREDPDVDAVRPFAVAGAEPGRNDPCWCGSGRKYKQCHLGRPASAPLAERVDWLNRKAVAYVERRGGVPADLMDLHAEVLAGEEGDLDTALFSPLVADTVLHEGGWFARFLADRGPLLPADERELATAWLGVRRGLYEVVSATRVRDLRTGAAVPVRSTPAPVGRLVVGRVVGEGTGPDAPLRFVGAVQPVDREQAAELLEALAGGDGLALLEVLAHTPPRHPVARRTVLHAAPPPAPPRPDAAPAVVRQLQERREQRWCDDPAPALGGATPREATADPARRDAVLALIAALPPADPASGRLGLRPDRLKDLLGLT